MEVKWESDWWHAKVKKVGRSCASVCAHAYTHVVRMHMPLPFKAHAGAGVLLAIGSMPHDAQLVIGRMARGPQRVMSHGIA